MGGPVLLKINDFRDILSIASRFIESLSYPEA